MRRTLAALLSVLFVFTMLCSCQKQGVAGDEEIIDQSETITSDVTDIPDTEQSQTTLSETDIESETTTLSGTESTTDTEPFSDTDVITSTISETTSSFCTEPITLPSEILPYPQETTFTMTLSEQLETRETKPINRVRRKISYELGELSARDSFTYQFYTLLLDSPYLHTKMNMSTDGGPEGNSTVELVINNNELYSVCNSYQLNYAYYDGKTYAVIVEGEDDFDCYDMTFDNLIDDNFFIKFGNDFNSIEDGSATLIAEEVKYNGETCIKETVSDGSGEYLFNQYGDIIRYKGKLGKYNHTIDFEIFTWNYDNAYSPSDLQEFLEQHHIS